MASPHYVAEFENEVHSNFRIKQKYFVELLYAGDNDAAADDLSRSLIFNTWLVSPVASPHYVAEFENEVNCNFRIEQIYFVE